MKRTILSFLLGGAITLTLFGGNHSPTVVSPVVIAQSANPRADSITGIRQDVANFNSAMDSFLAHRAEYVARAFNFVTGDCTGANSTSSFTCDDIDQAYTDFNTMVTDVRSGGTVSSGLWPNIIKVK